MATVKNSSIHHGSSSVASVGRHILVKLDGIDKRETIVANSLQQQVQTVPTPKRVQSTVHG